MSVGEGLSAGRGGEGEPPASRTRRGGTTDTSELAMEVCNCGSCCSSGQLGARPREVAVLVGYV